ncbi:MAG: serine/threonine-protein kinase [Polyangiales bacterium]
MSREKDSFDPLPEGTVVAERYVVEGLLGAGGMGAVHRARHVGTGRRVALKQLLAPSEELSKRMLLEARAMGAVDHPNVVTVLDVGEHDGVPFLVMELLAGRNLRDYAGKRALDPAEAIRLLLPAMQGVAAAHYAGLLHRDLKPENLFVLFDAAGRVAGAKVLDFGVARPLGPKKDLGLTRSGMVIGTPRYMAPEQLRAGSTLDERVDVFALGLILYELLTGRTPYEAESYESLVIEIATQNPPSPRAFAANLPEGLAQVVLSALARDPDARPPSVAAFAEALLPFAPGAEYVDPPHRGSRPSLDVVALAATYASTLDVPTNAVVGGTAATRAHRPPRPEPSPAAEAPARAPAAEASGDSPVLPIARPRWGMWIAAAIGACAIVVAALAVTGRRAPPPANADGAPSRATQATTASTSPAAPPTPPVVSAPAPLAPSTAAAATRPTTRSVAAPEATRAPRRATHDEPGASAPTAAPAPSGRTTPTEARGRAGVLHAEDF